MKRLVSSRCADLIVKPGLLRISHEEPPFLRRVRLNTDAVDGMRILYAANLGSRLSWARVANLALLALQRLFGKETASRPRRVSKGQIHPSDLPDPNWDQAFAMLRELISFMRSEAPEALAAQVILTQDGKMRAEGARDRPPSDPTGQRGSGQDTLIYPSYTYSSDDPITRLRK